MPEFDGMLNLFALVAFTGTSASTGTRDALVISAPQLDGHRPPFVKKRERCSAMEGGVALWSHARYRIMRDVGEGQTASLPTHTSYLTV